METGGSKIKESYSDKKVRIEVLQGEYGVGEDGTVYSPMISIKVKEGIMKSIILLSLNPYNKFPEALEIAQKLVTSKGGRKYLYGTLNKLSGGVIGFNNTQFDDIWNNPKKYKEEITADEDSKLRWVKSKFPGCDGKDILEELKISYLWQLY